MSKKKIGLVTIGQSPRVDLTPEMEPLMGENCELVEAGALDDLSSEEIERISPEEGEETYVSRLRSGDFARISKQKLLPLLQKKILMLEEKVSSTILVCTGSFPSIEHNKPLLFPDKILFAFVNSVIANGTLGVLIPLIKQEDSLKKKWVNVSVVVQSANPYQKDDDFITPALKLKELGATLIVLDCMGYTEEHKRIVKQATGLPVILSRSIVARVAAELS